MNILKRFLVYCIGLFILASGVTLSIKSNLGVSPISSLPYVLGVISGYETGKMIMLVFSFYVLLQLVILKKNFKIAYVIEIVYSVIFGYFVILTNFIFTFINPQSYILKFAILIISTQLIALGVIVYLKANLLPMPAEGLILALKTKVTTPFHTLKWMFDVIVVALSIILSYIFVGNIEGIREGTIIAAFLVGKSIGLINNYFSSHLHKISIFLDLPLE